MLLTETNIDKIWRFPWPRAMLVSHCVSVKIMYSQHCFCYGRFETVLKTYTHGVCVKQGIFHYWTVFLKYKNEINMLRLNLTVYASVHIIFDMMYTDL